MKNNGILGEPWCPLCLGGENIFGFEFIQYFPERLIQHAAPRERVLSYLWPFDSFVRVIHPKALNVLITFKSRAAGDVLMLGKNGQQMLEIVGKDMQDPRGIITVAQLPAAIEALSAAATVARAQAAPDNDDEDDDDQNKPRGMAAPVNIAQRIAPLLELCRYALRDEEPVIWEAS